MRCRTADMEFSFRGSYRTGNRCLFAWIRMRFFDVEVHRACDGLVTASPGLGADSLPNNAFRVPNRPHRMIAAKHNRTRAGTGEPPINTRWVRTAPVIVQTRSAAPKGVRRGIRSRMADATSMPPVT